jgi:hypothetical protein
MPSRPVTVGRSGKPPSPPPSVIPSYCKITIRPKPEILRQYVNTYMYVWLVNGSSFWMYPKKFNNYILSGYVWSGKGWETICFSEKLIDSIY